MDAARFAGRTARVIDTRDFLRTQAMLERDIKSTLYQMQAKRARQSFQKMNQMFAVEKNSESKVSRFSRAHQFSAQVQGENDLVVWQLGRQPREFCETVRNKPLQQNWINQCVCNFVTNIWLYKDVLRFMLEKEKRVPALRLAKNSFQSVVPSWWLMFLDHSKRVCRRDVEKVSSWVEAKESSLPYETTNPFPISLEILKLSQKWILRTGFYRILLNYSIHVHPALSSHFNLRELRSSATGCHDHPIAQQHEQFWT